MIHDMKIGEWVRVIGVPPGIRDDEELKTRALFDNCIGKSFRIEEIEHVDGLAQPLAELHVGDLSEREPSLEVIWVEPEYLERAEPTTAPAALRSSS